EQPHRQGQPLGHVPLDPAGGGGRGGAAPPRAAPAPRDLVRRDVERAHDVGAARNHDALTDGTIAQAPLSSIAVPTLVIHGTADPMFPLRHGQVLAERIPGGRLLALEDAGHGVERADWSTIVAAVLEHTAAGRS
ncbi:alpha/beta fold hydrolase, partial [Streptomyces sp. NPDC059742]|uniref:alpha/beta fold hydrolase n=1 Tax=Streptomyces sp. NPDC059742 TaxID=3346927 RepID=UPI003653DD69